MSDDYRKSEMDMPLELPEGQLLSGLDEKAREKLENDLADISLETGESRESLGGKLKKFLNTGYKGLTSVVMSSMTGPTACSVGRMIKQVGIEEAESRMAVILKTHLWELMERTFKDNNSRLVRYLFFSKTGRVIVLAAIAFPLTAALHVQAARFKEAEDETCAKLCIILSRVLTRMAMEEGVRALDIDNRVRKGLNWVVGLLAKEGVNPDTLLGSADKEYKSLGGSGSSLLSRNVGYNDKGKKKNRR